MAVGCRVMAAQTSGRLAGIAVAPAPHRGWLLKSRPAFAGELQQRAVPEIAAHSGVVGDGLPALLGDVEIEDIGAGFLAPIYECGVAGQAARRGGMGRHQDVIPALPIPDRRIVEHGQRGEGIELIAGHRSERTRVMFFAGGARGRGAGVGATFAGDLGLIDRDQVELVEQIDRLALDDLDAMQRVVIGAAEKVGLGEFPAFGRSPAADRAVDARHQPRPSGRRQVGRTRA